MKVQSEKTGPCEFTLTIEVDQDRTKRAVEKTARDITRRAPIPGFRPGKAPYRIIESYFGKEVIYNRALESLGPEIYEEALNEAGLEPYAQGNLDVEEYEPLTLTAVVPVQPVVQLGDYRSIRQDLPELEFDETEIDEAIAELRQRHATWKPVERAAEEGDQVTIDLVGTVDGEEVISQNSRRTLITSEMYPEGLYDNVVGLEPGASADYEVEFDEEDTNPKLAGKTVSFHLEVLGVNEKEIPELNQDFAKTVGGEYETVEELREGIRNSLHTSKEEDVREEAASQILLAVLQDAELEYPEVAVEREIDLQMYEIRQRLQSQGFSWESYLNMQAKSEEELRDDFRPGAEQNLRETLALQEIARREDIKVGDEEIEAEIDKLVEPYGPQAEAFRPIFATETNKATIRRRLLLNKTMDWLIEMASGKLEETETAEGEAPKVEEAEVSETEDVIEPETQEGSSSGETE